MSHDERRKKGGLACAQCVRRPRLEVELEGVRMALYARAVDDALCVGADAASMQVQA